MAALSSTSRLSPGTPGATSGFTSMHERAARTLLPWLKKNCAFLDHLRKDRETIAHLSPPKFIKAIERASKGWKKKNEQLHRIVKNPAAIGVLNKCKKARAEIANALLHARCMFQRSKLSPDFTNIPKLEPSSISPEGLTDAQIRILFDHLATRTDIFPWDYKIEGCAARSLIMVKYLLAAGVPEGFIYKRYLFVAPQYATSLLKSLNWRFHVAISVRKVDDSVVFDPSLESQYPLSSLQWLAHQHILGNPDEPLDIDVRGYYTTIPDSIDHTFGESLLLDLRSSCILDIPKFDPSQSLVTPCKVLQETFAEVEYALNSLYKMRAALDVRIIKASFPNL